MEHLLLRDAAICVLLLVGILVTIVTSVSDLNTRVKSLEDKLAIHEKGRK